MLVSGAGIAGLACALELGTRGHDVTVVEYARRLRLNGTPIDIRGDAIEAVDGMGLRAEIQKRRVRMSELTRFVDSAGEPVARIPMAEVSDSDDDIELLREDLVRILAEALPDTAAIRFGDSIETLTDDGVSGGGDGGVDVRFASGRTGRYDLVLGADGQHSAVRRLVFGPEEDYLRHLGVYFALADHPGEASSEGPNSIYNVPGRMAGLFRYQGKAVAVFQFRSERIDYDHHDLDAQKKILVDAFAGYRSWRIPELLDAALADPGFFFTSASQIHLPSWHRGRVALVGDAGYSPAFLSGRGTSLALMGARFLAEELERCGGDHTAAFARYEARQRPYVTFAQNRVHSGRDRMLPTTWAAIAARNETLRATQATPDSPERTTPRRAGGDAE
ncbi:MULTISPECIES: FAD-dependent monooxygenase [Streptomyces]|uniref:FAD-dependent monooxygenase n=1 Tax=Streptomyces koelreuteriae TaxID=2838015 RepID=A0ABX8G599_9ACTN|nr:MULTISPECIES: FAD-dependent monooxygenase [Streptomyces]QWB28541.1 FAD-dependent monooxygenase [Streptomyces koelreuteriae]UUA11537.1 FAD-dependent monooxygenase [Streptomyces koelreuteriae]UUA19133.1 FAD-dependent monooxygenase [Streptomyces sp. CRCS-T-1]